MRARRLSILLAAVVMLTLIGTACKTDVPDATRIPTPEFNPTPAGEASPVPTQPPVVSTSPSVPARPAGNAANGESLFTSNGCSGCHAKTDARFLGPGLAGVWDRAADRIPGTSAEDYILMSITDPAGFVVEGYPNAMPTTFGSLPQSDLQDLVAYLAILE